MWYDCVMMTGLEHWRLGSKRYLLASAVADNGATPEELHVACLHLRSAWL